MLSRWHRKIIIRASIPAAILFYCSSTCLWVYLLVGLGGILIWRRSPEKMANFFTNMATVVVTFFILAVLLEIGLHLKPHLFIGNQGPDTLGDFADFTSRGYLTEEIFNKLPGAFRIMSLGDSFAVYPPEGNPKLNYNHILAEKFAALGQRRVDLVNFGMPAVGPGYYWHILERYGERIRPDLVMVGFFTGNDFEEWEMTIDLGNYLTEPLSLKRKLLGYGHFHKWRLYNLKRLLPLLWIIWYN
jgi:hypothetical protein